MRRIPAPTVTNIALTGTILLATAALGVWASVPVCLYFAYKYIQYQPLIGSDANANERQVSSGRNDAQAREPIVARPISNEQLKVAESPTRVASVELRTTATHDISDSTLDIISLPINEQNQHTLTEAEINEMNERLHGFFDMALQVQIDALGCNKLLEAKNIFENVMPLLYSVPGGGPDNGRRRSLATFNTGFIYEMGAPGVPRNLDKALEWYKKAVLMNAYGGYRAAFHICNIYQEMLGFNSPEARYWRGKTFRMFNEPHCKPTELDNKIYKTLILLYRPCRFKTREHLKKHFQDHKKEFGVTFNNPDNYQNRARELINQGSEIVHLYKNKIQTGFFKRVKESGKYEYVDLDAQGFISTYHVKEKETMTKIVLEATTLADLDPPQSKQSYIYHSCQR